MKREDSNISLSNPIDVASWYFIKKKYLDSAPDKYIKVKVLSDSMAPTLVKGDVIQIKSAVFYKPKVGSIIVFLHPNHDHTTIHRIVSIVEKGNNIFYRTKGDANSKKDYYLVPANEVIGVMV